MNRRQFLRAAGVVAAQAVAAPSLWACSGQRGASGPGPYGPLQEPDANGLMLPEGFRSRVVARGGEVVPGTRHVWHRAADGGAVFPAGDGWIYVSNSELDPDGGVGALRFDRDGRVAAAYPICRGTRRNCAGGATPWGTWLSCEEVPDGGVYECDPAGERREVLRPALGRFRHEATATLGDHLYLTEDQSDGLLYRFTPERPGDLSRGLLEAAVVDGAAVHWEAVPTPAPGPGDPPTRHQVPSARRFDRGEGMIASRGHVYFATTGDDRLWDYDPVARTLRIFYDGGGALADPDNLAAADSGDLFVAEDSDNLEIVLFSPEGEGTPFIRVTGQRGTELTGPAFDPTGRRLYFSSQRGGAGGGGLTYEVAGPFRGRQAETA